MVYQRGFTLFELVVAIVVVGLAAAAIMAVFASTLGASADPLVRVQGRTLATAYMDEVLLRDFGDGSSCVGTDRGSWQTIWCYDGLNEAPRTQFDTPIPELSAYNVAVAVTGSSDVATITVDVTHPGGFDYRLESRRGNY